MLQPNLVCGIYAMAAILALP